MATIDLAYAADAWRLRLRKRTPPRLEAVVVDAATLEPVTRAWQVNGTHVAPEQTRVTYRCARGREWAPAELVRCDAAGRPVEDGPGTLRTPQHLAPASYAELLEHVTASVYDLEATSPAPPAPSRCAMRWRRGAALRTAFVVRASRGLVCLAGDRHGHEDLVGPADTPRRHAPAVHVDAPGRVVQLATGREPTHLRTPAGDRVEARRVVVEGELAGAEVLEEAETVWRRPDGSLAGEVEARVLAVDAGGPCWIPAPQHQATVGPGRPLVLEGGVVAAEQVLRAWAVTRVYRWQHADEAAYGWLWRLARELGGGLRPVRADAGDGAIVLVAGGRRYRGWLSGAVNGERYRVLLHLADVEL